MTIEKVAIFDIDGTLFETNGGNFVIQALKSKNKKIKMVGWYQLLLAPICIFFYLFINMSLAVKMLIYALNGCLESDYSKCMSEYRPIKINSVCNILKNHLDNPNTLVVTITASPKVCLSAQVVKLGVPLENQYGAQPEKNSQGVYTGNAQMLVNGYTKKQIAQNLVKKHNLDKKNVYFYTDSFQDLPLLKWAGHSYLVRPNFIMKYLGEYYNFKIIN